MAIRDYKDFVLVADNVEKNDNDIKKFTVSVFDSPVGQGEYKETVIVPSELTDQLGMLERRKFDDDLSGQMELGEILSGLLLPSYARKLFSESLKRLRNDEGLRLRLRLADELADFPWEYMYVQDGRGERRSDNFLATDPRISIVRHEAIAVPADWFGTPESRRIIVAMASPQPYEKYPKLTYLSDEQVFFKEALSTVRGLEPVYIPELLSERTQGVNLEGLISALMDRTDIFHFSGHGEFIQTAPSFGRKVGEGALIFCDEKIRGYPFLQNNLLKCFVVKGFDW